MPTDLKGWHPGEKAIQMKLHFDGPMSEAWTWIENYMPDQHRQFHTTRLPFIPITTLDKDGRPWGSLAAGAGGRIGFVSSPSYTELTMHLTIQPGDPLSENLQLFRNDHPFLTAGIGIEFSTRRRNKFAGHVKEIFWKNDKEVQIQIEVNQTIGNCPKYINVRDLVPQSRISPTVVYRQLNLTQEDRLPDELIAFIHSADTVFIGTSYVTSKENEDRFPSHVGMNQRGGRAGFVRVRPSDCRTVVLPDFSGNRLLSSLGNIEVTRVAALTFTDFISGDVLYLTGVARTLVGSEAQKLMPRQNVLTTLYVTGYIYVKDSLPVRQRQGTTAERSPYSPPVLFLAEEKPSDTMLDDVTVTLQRIKLHTPTLATFDFRTSQPVHIKPGQTAILGFTGLLGERQYQHMAAGDETSVNDDRIRTWTVSSAHLDPKGTTQFALTMREKPGGLVTGALFSIARRLVEMRPELLDDATPLALQVQLVGIGGDFVLHSGNTDLLWIAGGIGVTPFLSMLASLSEQKPDDSSRHNIVLVLSTREPHILLPMILTAYGKSSSRFVLHIFTDRPAPKVTLPPTVSTTYHKGRVTRSFFSEISSSIKGRVTYLCGPPSFENTAVAGLSDIGYNASQIIREGFTY